ncbi:MAG TPA: DUF922 domain-containing protein, partial [Anaerolineae bacterium]|nr:DUF922 domain-containing protein [Anaerolineae bacterium]
TPVPRPSATRLPSRTAAPSPAPTDPQAGATPFGLVALPRATVIYYEVSGRTAEELRAQLDALGPVDRSGQRWDAICNWDYWWSWPGLSGGGCDLGRATVTYRVEVTFPHWAPPAEAPADLVNRWAGYVQALAVHEQGHVDRAIAAVGDIQEALAVASCETANDAAQTAVARVQAENDAYDEITGHGAQQGAQFP